MTTREESNVSVPLIRGFREGTVEAYRGETPVHLRLENKHHERREHKRDAQHQPAQLPRHLAFSCPGICEAHDDDGVEGG